MVPRLQQGPLMADDGIDGLAGVVVRADVAAVSLPTRHGSGKLGALISRAARQGQRPVLGAAPAPT